MTALSHSETGPYTARAEQSDGWPTSEWLASTFTVDAVAAPCGTVEGTPLLLPPIEQLPDLTVEGAPARLRLARALRRRVSVLAAWRALHGAAPGSAGGPACSGGPGSRGASSSDAAPPG